MRNMSRLRSGLIVALGVAALVIPAGALATPGGNHGKGNGKGHGKGHAHCVAFVFKGAYKGESAVEVLHGNAHVRKGGFVGQLVTFDFTEAAIVASDVSPVGAPDGQVNLEDVQEGDRVLVKACLPRKTEWEEGEAAIKARRLVDQTHPPTS
jgi:hypothetical protein